MISEMKRLPAIDACARIVSAAGAVLMTSAIVLAMGIGFPAHANAQVVHRLAVASILDIPVAVALRASHAPLSASGVTHLRTR